jgi:hypothetical protein
MTTFTTKETYLEFRANWKAEYNEVSDTIRNSKKIIKREHREHGFAKTPNIWRTLFVSVRRATEMLAILQEAKLEAGRQYNLQKELL